MDLNKLAQDIYQQNVAAGWWSEDTCIYTKLQLISTEITEATEGERKDLMDDHLPHRKMGEVELADALMRTLDLGEHLELEVSHTAYMGWANDATPAKHHLMLTMLLADFAEKYRVLKSDNSELIEAYSKLCNSIVHTANTLGYDIFTALEEKKQYNKTRADHQLENRVKENGKKF